MARQRNTVVIRPSQRRQRSKLQREQGKQRAIIVAGIIAIVFILAIPAYGYWSNFVAPPRSVVLQVDDTKYTLGFMAKYLEGLRRFSGGQIDLSTEPFRFLQVLEENEIIKSGALSKGATVDSAEIDQEVRDRVIGSSPELANVPPDQLEREFKESYKQYLNTINLSQSEHRSLVEGSLLRDKLTEILGAEVPTISKQVNMSWIVISTQADDEDQELLISQRIQLVSNRLKLGDDFADLAEEFSDDRSTAVNGGEYGWIPENTLGFLDETIFSLEPGETSEAISGEALTYFIKVTDVDEARVIEPEMRNRLKEASLQLWLVQERGNHRVSLCFGGGSAGGSCDWQYDWIVKQLIEASLK